MKDPMPCSGAKRSVMFRCLHKKDFEDWNVEEKLAALVTRPNRFLSRCLFESVSKALSKPNSIQVFPPPVILEHNTR